MISEANISPLWRNEIKKQTCKFFMNKVSEKYELRGKIKNHIRRQGTMSKSQQEEQATEPPAKILDVEIIDYKI